MFCMIMASWLCFLRNSNHLEISTELLIDKLAEGDTCFEIIQRGKDEIRLLMN